MYAFYIIIRIGITSFFNMMSFFCFIITSWKTTFIHYNIWIPITFFFDTAQYLVFSWARLKQYIDEQQQRSKQLFGTMLASTEEVKSHAATMQQVRTEKMMEETRREMESRQPVKAKARKQPVVRRWSEIEMYWDELKGHCNPRCRTTAETGLVLI